MKGQFEEIIKKLKLRSELMSKRYSNIVTPSGIKIIRIVQSLIDEDVVLIHIKWSYKDGIPNFEELQKYQNECLKYWNVKTEIRRV
jgi:hypothetical protein